MAIGTKAAIFTKARKLTGRTDSQQLSDSELDDYLNTVYNYHLPAKYRSLKLKDKYTFNTTQGIDTYEFNSEKYTTIEMPCYCMKREIALFTDPWSFYGANFNWQQQTNFDTGDGTSGPYEGNTTAHPLIRSINNNPSNVIGTPNVPGVSQGYSGYPAGRVQNILITANITNGTTMNVTDDGSGNLIGDCTSGSIDYATGAITNLSFTSNIPSGEPIQIQYNPVTLAIPLAVMYFQNQIVLRPVPNRGYTIELTAYRQPSQALSQTGAQAGTPELTEWWEAVAVLMAKLIYEDDMDMEGVASMDRLLQDKYDMIDSRVYGQLGSKRVNTIYQDQLNYNYGANGFGMGPGV